MATASPGKPKKPQRPFSVAFKQLLLARAGVEIADQPFNQGNLDRKLLKALPDREEHLEDADVSWSAEAADFVRIVRSLGSSDPDVRSKSFVTSFFKKLDLRRAGIIELDAGVCGFRSLTSLDVSQNGIRDIKHLPTNLKVLQAYMNGITDISTPPMRNVVHCGLGSNELLPLHVTMIGEKFAGLLSLDLSYNRLHGMSDVLQSLRGLRQVRHLYLFGNPCTLVENYRCLVLRTLPHLRVLDEHDVKELETSIAEELLVDWGAPVDLPLPFSLRLVGLKGVQCMLMKHMGLPKKRINEETGEEAEEIDPMPAMKQQVSGGLALELQLLPLGAGEWVSTTRVPLEAVTDELTVCDAALQLELPFQSVEEAVAVRDWFRGGPLVRLRAHEAPATEAPPPPADGEAEAPPPPEPPSEIVAVGRLVLESFLNPVPQEEPDQRPKSTRCSQLIWLAEHAHRDDPGIIAPLKVWDESKSAFVDRDALPKEFSVKVECEIHTAKPGDPPREEES